MVQDQPGLNRLCLQKLKKKKLNSFKLSGMVMPWHSFRHTHTHSIYTYGKLANNSRQSAFGRSLGLLPYEQWKQADGGKDFMIEE